MASKRITAKRSVALLRSERDYRDAEEIAGRLHHLSAEYHQTIEPIIANLADKEAWYYTFLLLDGYEGYIVDTMHWAIAELQEMLNDYDPISNTYVVPSKVDVSRVARRAGELAADIQSTLAKLEVLRNRILGYSGEQGLMALFSSSEQERAAAAVTVKEFRMGDIYNVQGAGAVGPGATATDVKINQTWQSLENHDTESLARELAVLRAELKLRATDAEHDLATGEVASAQLAAEKGDGPAVIAHLARVGKWTLEVATSIGTTVAAAAIKAAIGI